MNNLEVLISRNSTKELLRENLTSHFSIANFAVTSDYKIYIDHHTSHEPVEKDN